MKEKEFFVMLNKKLLIFIYFQVINFFKLIYRPLNKINTFNFYLTILCMARIKISTKRSIILSKREKENEKEA